jgi:hypothetical protein
MARVGRDDTPANREKLFELFLQAELYAPTPEGPAEEQVRMACEDDPGTVLTHGMSADGPVLALFTSVDRMLEWAPEGCGYLAMNGLDMFEMAARAGMVRIEVNPASETFGVIERWEMEVLARGHLPIDGAELTPAGTRLKIGAPAKRPPEEVLEAVREELSKEHLVATASLFLVQEEPRPPEYLVVVGFVPEASPDARGDAMVALVNRAGNRHSGVRDLVFVERGEMFSDVQGELLFERRA